MVVVWLFGSEITVELVIPVQTLSWLVPCHNLSTPFPALSLNQINYFNFAKQASCWSLGCHSAALFQSHHKIKHCFCFPCHPLGDSYQLFPLLPKAATWEWCKLLPWPSRQPWPALGFSRLFQPVFFCLPGCLFPGPCWAAPGDLFSLLGNVPSSLVLFRAVAVLPSSCYCDDQVLVH